MPGPLPGTRIVDLTIALSGPLAIGILADQGADVVKVETPGIGDIGRWVGVARGGISAMAQMANRGKRSIAVAPDGTQSADGTLCAWVPAPFRFCLRCGIAYGFRQSYNFV